MAQQWYFRTGELEHGPLSVSELMEYARAGAIEATTPVRRGELEWLPAETYGFLNAAQSRLNEVSPSGMGGASPDEVNRVAVKVVNSALMAGVTNFADLVVRAVETLGETFVRQNGRVFELAWDVVGETNPDLDAPNSVVDVLNNLSAEKELETPASCHNVNSPSHEKHAQPLPRIVRLMSWSKSSGAHVDRASAQRPLGHLTYEEASDYFRAYCKLMENGIGMCAPESLLPTTFDRMKEALKVECLNWWNRGDDFDETWKFMGTGYVRLASFLPDEFAECRSLDSLHLLGELDDSCDETDAAMKVYKTSQKIQDCRRTAVYAEWDEFGHRFRDIYQKGGLLDTSAPDRSFISREVKIALGFYGAGCVLLYSGIPGSLVVLLGEGKWELRPAPDLFSQLLTAVFVLAGPFFAAWMTGLFIFVPGVLLWVGYDWLRSIFSSSHGQ